MNTRNTFDQIVSRLQEARWEVENEVERLLETQREQFKYSLRQGKVVFDRRVRNWQKRQRTSSVAYILGTRIGTLLSAPVIYGMIIPLLLLDLSISVYQAICFRIYQIPRVARSDYMVIDRHRLPYLNTIQKLNCAYCGYGNGLIAYAREIIARTEQYWCPIKHATRPRDTHDREVSFFAYGDFETWASDVDRVRCDWADCDRACATPD